VSQLPQGGNRFSEWLGTTLLKITGWKVKGQLPDIPKVVIAVGPHSSNWDFFLGVAVLFYLRIKIRFLGKHTIFKPVFKQLLEWIGGMPVDRRNSSGVVKQVAQHFEQNEKMILALAPEGTRSPVFPWKTGFLAIAYHANVPVLLIGFDFKNKDVVIGPLFTPSGVTSADMKKVYQFYQGIPAKYPHKVLYE
jgi:1-acyl-sn-glycerol-3-phosphate acyltransferase